MMVVDELMQRRSRRGSVLKTSSMACTASGRAMSSTGATCSLARRRFAAVPTMAQT